MNQKDLVETEQTHEPITLVESDMAQRLKEYGRSKGWTFEILPYRGVLDTAVGNNEWTYEPYINQPLIKEAERRLFEVGLRFPLAGLVYGDEVEDPLPKIEWEKIREVTTTVFGALVTAAGTAVVIGAAALTHTDPCLIVVLDDEERTWVTICTWL